MHRIERLQEEIQRAVSFILLLELTDPLIRGVTVTRVTMTRDLGIARIYYEIRGTKEEQRAVQRGLDRASSFIRRQLAPRLNVKTVPELKFFYDETSDEISRIDKLFSKL